MLSFKLFRLCLWHLLVTSLFFSMIESRSWASRPDDPKPCGERNLVHDRERYEPADSAAELFSSQVGTIPASHLQPSHASSLLCLTQFPKSLFSDQKAIWASPFHLRTRDESWVLPMGITLLGLFASDTTIMRHMGDSALPHSNSFSNYAVAGMIGAAATMYLRGVATQDEHSRETGVSAAEAAIDSAILGEVMKVTFGRSRPNATNAGSFRAGGASFPSEHALAAWSLASVVAQEYPGTLTKFVAYGGAAGISLARVAARQHFPSDVVVGSLLGYAVGHYVYRAHHDPALAGASNSSYQKLLAEKAPPRRRTPAELGSPYVPIDSWAYPAFDRLAALGYVPSAYANLRPWTRMECARLVVATDEDLLIDAPRIDLPVHYADNDFPTAHGPANDAPAKNQRIGGAGAGKKSSTEAERIAIALRTEFAGEILLIEDRDKSVDESASDSEIRVEEIYSRYFGIAGTPLDDSYHFGQTLINDFGRPYGQGSNTIEGAAASGSSGPAAFYVRGEYQHAAALPVYSLAVQQMLGEIDLTTPQLPIHTATLDQFRLLDAYAAWNFKTVQVSAGRQSLWWGPGRGGPPNFSDNAEPMDMLRLTNPSPWLLPGFLHWLGPMRWDFFLGLMAGHHFPHEPGIDGQKLSFKPTPNLEFGFSRTIVFRPVTLHMFWRGFSSFGDNKTTIPGSAADVGDRRGGFDFSYRIPRLRNWLVLYNDGMTDDDTSPLGAPQRALMNPGVYLPQIPRAPKLDFRVELVWSDPPELSNRGGRYVYYNGAYHDSYTNGGQIIGSWVGREGHGVQLWCTYWLSPRSPLQLGYRRAHVDRDFIPQGGNIQDFFARATFPLRKEIEIAAFLQYERWDFPVLAPLAGPDTVASIELKYHPDWKKVLNFR